MNEEENKKIKKALISAIIEIRNNRSLFTLDEASIKSSVVQRFLSMLGWDPFDVNEVKPEYTVESIMFLSLYSLSSLRWKQGFGANGGSP